MKTEKHDRMHLWMHNDANQQQFVEKILSTIKPSEIEEKSEIRKVQLGEISSTRERFDFRATRIDGILGINKKIEVPIVSGKSVSHTNTIDCLLEVTLICDALKTREDENWDKGKPQANEQFKVFILCEYKPKLEEISSILGQIHLYVKRVYNWKNEHRNPPTIIPVLITLDDMHDFDYLFTDEDIRIFRLSWDANTNTVVNLPEPNRPETENIQTKVTGE